MSIVETVSVIFRAYKYFKETYRQLGANEVSLQQLLEEIFLYEALILIYAEKINDPSSPDGSSYEDPIKLFSKGISGVHNLLLDYTSKEHSRLRRAWNFCKNWCSTADNAAKINEYTENISRAVKLLGFAGEVLILNKVERIREEQAEFQNKLCVLLGNFTENATRSASFNDEAVRSLAELLGATESVLRREISENSAEIRLVHEEAQRMLEVIVRVGDKIDRVDANLVGLGKGVDRMADGLGSLRERMIAMQSGLQKLAERHDLLSAESSRRCFLHFIVNEEAKQFWRNYFPFDEQVTWLVFSAALCKEYPLLSKTKLQCVRKELDINCDGQIHAREFNIYTMRAGLSGPVHLPAVADDGGEAECPAPLVDLCIVMDTTGSMLPWLNEAKARCADLHAHLSQQLISQQDIAAGQPPFRVGFVSYKDFGDEGHLSVCQLGDMEAVCEAINGLSAGGGDDVAEDVGGALRLADGLAWRAPQRVLVHFFDAPPHGSAYHTMAEDEEEADKYHANPARFDRYADSVCLDRVVDLHAVLHSLADKRIKYTAVRCGEEKHHRRTARFVEICKEVYAEARRAAVTARVKGQLPSFKDKKLGQGDANQYLSIIVASTRG